MAFFLPVFHRANICKFLLQIEEYLHTVLQILSIATIQKTQFSRNGDKHLVISCQTTKL